MNRRQTGDPLDRAVEAMRDDRMDSDVAEQASRRVWARLEAAGARAAAPHEVERIRGCADYQALVPALVRGALSPARATLVEDHLRECVPCRRELRRVRGAGSVADHVVAVQGAPAARRSPAWSPRYGVAAAATALLVLAVGGALVVPWLAGGSADASARLASVDGAIYRVSDAALSPLPPGSRIAAGEVVRTARGAGAVLRLADGSSVELRERSELALDRRGDGVAIELARGSVIVEASPQGSGHLYVTTSDCDVAVTGTIFSVSHGALGSRVAVLEGEVHVEHGRAQTVLEPGDQVSTQPGGAAGPIADEISWSRNAARYMPLLAELDDLGRELDRSVTPIPVRHAAELLDRVPAGTVIYAAFPNVSTQIGQAQQVLRERMASSTLLRHWWEETFGAPDAEEALGEISDRIRAYGELVGDEIVLTAQADASGTPASFLVLAEVRDAARLRSLLEADLRRAPRGSSEPEVSVLDRAALAGLPATDGGERLLLVVDEGLFLASPSAGALQAALAAPARGLSGTRFGQRIRDAYAEGTSWLFCADAGRLIPRDAEGAGALDRAGLLDLDHVVVEQKEVAGRSMQRATLSFGEARTGIASWLAEPSPMGGLEFVTPDAMLLAAFVVKEPVELVEDLISLLESGNPDVRTQLAAFEAEHGISIVQDVAAPIGGEFAFALDGPVLPKPAWKVVLEVYDPARMQATLARAIEHLGSQDVSLREERDGDRTWYALRTTATDVHYTFHQGYLVAAPTRALVERAIETRESGLSLPHSARFTSRLPAGTGLHVSAIGYERVAAMLAQAQRAARPSTGGGDRDDADGRDGTLAWAVAGPDRIVFSSSSPKGTVSDLLRIFELRALLEAGQEP